MSLPVGINPQPISKRGIQEHNPQIQRIYTGKGGRVPTFEPYAQKRGGTALGTIFQKAHFHPSSTPCSQWLGKVGLPTGRLKDDIATIRSRTQMDINLDTIREKLGYDLYQEFGRGVFRVPKTRLSSQIIMDHFNLGHQLAVAWSLSEIRESLRIMSQMSDDYKDLRHATISVGGFPIDFVSYLRSSYRPPTSILTPDGKEVPLKGMMGLLAVGRVLADTDIIGGSGGNAGFVWEYDSEGNIIAAQVVKIDPGECFMFTLKNVDEKGNVYPSDNWVLNTRNRHVGGQTLEDPKDIQIAKCDSRVTIKWNLLSPEQKDEFLSVLFNCSRYLTAEEILKYLLYRDGKFNRSPLEQIPEEVALELQKELQEWLKIQLEEIYHVQLQEFKLHYPEQVLRAEYIDRWGELELPASDQKFPIRELFTQLTLVEANMETKPTKHPPSELPERDSLIETQEKMDLSASFVSLEALFDRDGQKPAPRKILVLGRAGIGKSTLCQKIAHDWGSGRLWADRYKAIYWLPLRELNGAVEEGGFLFKEKDLNHFIAKAVAHIRLRDTSLIDSVVHQLQHHRQEIIIILDGWDEASPLLVQSLEPLLNHPELNLLLTSRPGVTESIHRHLNRIVENIGFSKKHISQYVQHFFSRAETKAEVALARKEKFLATLGRERNLHTVAHIPLILQMLCVQWESGAEHVGFAPSLAGLYSDMVDTLFQWQCRKEGIDPYAVSGLEKAEVLSVLGKIGLTGLREGKLIIPGQLVSNTLQTARVSERALLRTGLLRATGEGLTREYCFLHLTFQEYVIAFSITLKSPAEQKAFIVEHRCKPQFQLVLALMAGIIDRQDPTKEKLKEFFDQLHTAPGDLTGFYQLALTLRCMQQCTDSVIQDWIEEKYHVYSSLLKALKHINKRKANEIIIDWAKNCLDYLKGSKKIPPEILLAVLRYGDSPIGYQLFGLIDGLSAESCFDLFQTILQSIDEIDYRIQNRLSSLCGKFSEEQWTETFEACCHILKVSSFENKIIALKVLVCLCGRCPARRWKPTFKTVCQFLKEVNYDNKEPWELVEGVEIKTGLLNALDILYRTCPPEYWNNAFKIACLFLKDTFSEVQLMALKILEVLCESCPSEQWEEMYTIFLNTLEKGDQKNDKEVCTKAIHNITVLCRRSPLPDQWCDIFKTLLRVDEAQPKNINRSLHTALKGLSSHCPPGKWREMFWFFATETSGPVNSNYNFKSFCHEISEKLPDEMLSQLQVEFAKGDSQARKTVVWALTEITIIYRLKLQYDKKKLTFEKIEKIHGYFERIFTILLKALQDSDSSVRAQAISTLKELCEDCSIELWNRIVKILQPFLKDLDDYVKIQAAKAWENLSRQCPSEHWNDLFKSIQPLLSDPDEDVLEEATSAMWNMSEQCPPEHWHEFFETLRPLLTDSIDRVRYYAVWAMEKICEDCPPSHWKIVLEALRPCLNDSDKDTRENAIEALAHLNFIIPSKNRTEILKGFCRFVMNLGKEVSEKNPAGPPLENNDLNSWQDVFQALCQSDDHRDVVRIWLKGLREELPYSDWQEVIQILCQIIDVIVRDQMEDGSEDETTKGDKTELTRLKGSIVETALLSVCKRPPIVSWKESFKTLQQGLVDPNGYLPEIVSRGLSNLAKQILPEGWMEFFEVASQMLEKQEDSIVSDARKILELFSLHSFLEHLQFTPKYLSIFFAELGARKSPLYINKLPNGQLRLACIENNREITREISEDEFKTIKTTLQTHHPLRAYIAQYIGQESHPFNLDQLTQWLNLKFPQNWQVQEEGGVVYLGNPTEDNRLISRALAGLVEAADDLGLDALQIGKENRRITIRGKPEEIERLLTQLKGL